METEREEKTSIGEQGKSKTIIEYINIILSISSFLSLISGVIYSLGYIRVPLKYPIFIFCISISFYLLLNAESIIESKKKSKFLIYSLTIVFVLVGMFIMANWGADFKTDVKIDFSDKAYMNENITGTATNIPDGYKLWVLVYPKTAQKYYPQYDSIKIQDGKWSVPIRIGNENNTGEKFDIVAVLANQNANEIFESYKSYCDTGNCPGMIGIPEGAEIYDTFEVTRI
ncbi:hypothetical protein [uncultured Methanomethylovorans sp.]|uniref:hypothetical protein n=1 Tax=uncultured Methanomethylovorans sp. TaxID=183759 RepID=UPI002AA6B68E|nr:hypothetical protein [uncultured Methanomethylovorans sp.]